MKDKGEYIGLKKGKEPKGICSGCVNYKRSEFEVIAGWGPRSLDLVTCSMVCDVRWSGSDPLHEERLRFMRADKVLKCKWFIKKVV